jgi:hypothetical protein
MLVLIKCPVCGLQMARLRPSHAGEYPRQHGLPAGWDCPLGHAGSVPVADFERARLEQFLAEVEEALGRLRPDQPTTQAAGTRDKDPG